MIGFTSAESGTGFRLLDANENLNTDADVAPQAQRDHRVCPMNQRRIDEIRPGYYRIRIARRGPWIAACIAVEGDTITVMQDGAPHAETFRADAIADLIIDSVMEGEAFRHPLLRIAWFGEAIDEAEYRHLLALGAWARDNRPSHPAAQPDKPIDLNAVPIADIF